MDLQRIRACIQRLTELSKGLMREEGTWTAEVHPLTPKENAQYLDAIRAAQDTIIRARVALAAGYFRSD